MYSKPDTWGECQAIRLPERGCPFVSCRHHMLIEVGIPNRNGGTALKRAGVHALRPNATPEQVEAWTDAAADALVAMPYTCSLHVAKLRANREAKPHLIYESMQVTKQAFSIACDSAIDAARAKLPAQEFGP